MLEQVGKNFALEEKAYSSLHLKIWYTCTRKSGLANAQAVDNLEQVYRWSKSTVRDLDEGELQSNCSSNVISGWAQQNASNSF